LSNRILSGFPEIVGLYLSTLAMFRHTKLDNKSVKYFAKQDFFLAENLADLEEQLRTTLDFLTLLSWKGSMAAKAYTYGLQFINKNCQVYESCQSPPSKASV
jgi:hypothetical protein